MKLRFWKMVLYTAWALDDLADAFAEWASQNYWNELHGIGSIE